jgi:hypothetical protein
MKKKIRTEINEDNIKDKTKNFTKLGAKKKIKDLLILIVYLITIRFFGILFLFL